MNDELSKGFTGIEINGVRFSNISEMLVYLNKQRDHIIELEAQIEKMKCCAKCVHCNTYITSCIPQKRFVRLEDVCEDFELRR